MNRTNSTDTSRSHIGKILRPLELFLHLESASGLFVWSQQQRRSFGWIRAWQLPTSTFQPRNLTPFRDQRRTDIAAATLLAVRMGLCTLPLGVVWQGIALIGCLGGIGFTMSIFISTLALADPQVLAAAKLTVLTASLLAGTTGLLIGIAIIPAGGTSRA